MSYGKQNVRVSFGSSFPAALAARSDWFSFDPELSKYLSIPTHINGIPIRGVVDTGATRSVITPQTCDRLGLSRCGASLATFFTKRYVMPLCRTGSLRVGPIDLIGTEVGCHELPNLELAFPGELSMIVGRDVLIRGLLECQFPNNRARLCTRLGESELNGYGMLELLHCDFGLPVIPVELEGRRQQAALLDLGNDAPCAVSAQYAEQEGLLNRKVSSTLSIGLEGEIVSQMITLRSLRIGHYELSDIPACVVPDWKSPMPINLGWPAFSAFDLAFVHDHELRVRASAAALAEPLPRDRSGIGAQRFADHLLVRHVAFNSPAEEVGLQPGDRVVAIDGRRVDRTYPTPGKQLGAQAEGTLIVLTIGDGRRVCLQLRNYF
ncbi:aspartyl protease family protein (plasmid) [Novosphingobium sp. BL-8A]|uniref:aspartyl protease family protein n=1 Tax=Novosphingobium sp. BL-8A TaxID=3127639 RepID=UPI0037573141